MHLNQKAYSIPATEPIQDHQPHAVIQTCQIEFTPQVKSESATERHPVAGQGPMVIRVCGAQQAIEDDNCITQLICGYACACG
jgi:hypothetical protein